MFRQLVAAALPRLLDIRTMVSYRWDTGGDNHHRIMAKHMSPSDCRFLTFGVLGQWGGGM